MPETNDVNHQFFEAVENGQLSKIEKFINDYGLSYLPDWLDGYALLRKATQYNQREVAKLLLRNGSAVNSKNGPPTSMHPLHYAVTNNDVELVEMLLNKGAHVDIKASNGSTPLLIALGRNYSHIVYLLLNHGAAFDIASTSWNMSGKTLLHFAFANRHENLVDLLLLRHADVNARDRYGSTPLHDAAESGNLHAISYLLNHGADINAKNLKNQTPLSLAVDTDNLTTVRNILSYKPDSSDEYNRSALCSAVKSTHISHSQFAPLVKKRNSKQIIEDLLDYGFAIKPHDVADTSLLYAAVENGYGQIVENLLICGADVNYSETKAWGKSSLLHTAVKEGQNLIVQLLIKYGANVNSKDKTSRTPMCLAIQTKNLEIAMQLLNNKAVVENSFDLLCLAIETKNTKTVEKMLSFNAVDVNATNSSGTTALHIAVQHRQTDHSETTACRNSSVPDTSVEENQDSIVQLLIKYGADVDSKDKSDRTPMCLTIQKKNLGIAMQLLDNKAVVQNSFDLLCLAIETKNTKTVEKILSFNAVDVNATNSGGKTALHIVIEHGQTEHSKSRASRESPVLHTAVKEDQNSMVQLLIKHGADLNSKDENGRTPMDLAIQTKNVGIAMQLLDNKAVVESSFDLLCLAIETKNTKTVEKMLSFHAIDVNATNSSRTTALHIAIEHDQIQHSKTGAWGKSSLLHSAVKEYRNSIVELLIKHGADVDSKDKTDRTPMCLAIQTKNLGIAMQLLDNKAVVQNSFDLLCLAIETKNTKTVEKMLSFNAVDVNATNSGGKTALHIVIERGQIEMVKLFLDKGTNVNNVPANRETALFQACKKGYNEVVEILLEFGAKSELKGITYAIPLHIAAKNNDKKVVEILLQYDADIEFKNDNGETALHIASRNGSVDVINILLEHGSDINSMTKKELTAFHLADYFYPSNLAIGMSNWRFQRATTVIEYLQRHMIKLTAANLYLNKRNVRSMDSSAFENFPTNCQEEIKNMKSKKIVDNISFYDILTKGMNKLTAYSRNENVMQVLTTDEYKTRFPIYASMMDLRFKKGIRRKDLLEQSYQFFHILSDSLPVLPHICTENICIYLSNSDLRILVNISK